MAIRSSSEAFVSTGMRSMLVKLITSERESLADKTMSAASLLRRPEPHKSRAYAASSPAEKVRPS